MSLDNFNMTKRDLMTGSRQEACAEAVAEVMYDKWAILDDLSAAGCSLGINHRSLAVLRALISFHPARQLVPIMGSAVVFPSNKTLCERLGGMPESTLRRHIAHLVNAGLIARRDSANRKRFCRRSKTQALAFGFDLGPLALRAQSIRALADEARDTQDQIGQIRTALLSLRQRMLDHIDESSEIIQDLGRAMRRKLDLSAWKALWTHANEQFQNICQLTKTDQSADKMSGSNSQNERHIEPEHIKKINSGQWVERVTAQAEALIGKSISSAPDAADAARQIAPMLGLRDQDLQRYEDRHGATTMALTTFTLLAAFHNVEHTIQALRSLMTQSKPILSLERMVRDAGIVS